MSLTHEFLASLLVLRRPGVTTATHDLKGAGTVRAERVVMIVVDRAKLENLAHAACGPAEHEYERLTGPT